MITWAIVYLLKGSSVTGEGVGCVLVTAILADMVAMALVTGIGYALFAWWLMSGGWAV